MSHWQKVLDRVRFESVPLAEAAYLSNRLHFPKDADIKNKWILASGRYSWFPQKYNTLCSEHIGPELFLKKNKNVRLAKGAVPTLKLHPVFDEDTSGNNTPNTLLTTLSIPPKWRKMVLTLYKLDASPPVRSVRMLLDILGLEANYVEVNLMAAEHLTPEFKKKNPLHSVPTLTDGDFSIGESNAIAAYLVDKYAKDDSLYPKDLEKRALINHRLLYNCGILYKALRDTGYDIAFGPIKVGRVTETRKEELSNAYILLEALIDHTGGPWLAGDQLTIADICTMSNASSTATFYPIDPVQFPKTHAWLQKCSELPTFQKYNVPGNEVFAAISRSNMTD